MYQRDHDYWNEYYRQKLAEDQPSLFAQYVFKSLYEGESLIDLGSGNGRDALYFCRNGICVTAMDQSETGISMISEAEPKNIRSICGDITKASSYLDSEYDNAYSRFVIHALTEEQQRDFIKDVRQILKQNGRFWIEVRSVLDTLFGKGEPAGRNAYIHDGHFRRFIVLGELVKELEANGFEVLSADEKAGFAPYRGDDPPVIRVMARKR